MEPRESNPMAGQPAPASPTAHASAAERHDGTASGGRLGRLAGELSLPPGDPGAIEYASWLRLLHRPFP